MGKCRIVIIAVLIACMAAAGAPEFLLSGPYSVRALTYHFFHASWWHLAVNCLATWTIFVPSRKCHRLLPVAFFIAVMVYPLSLRPVIGFSNVLYAVLGLRTPSFKSKWWGQSSVIVFLAVTVAMVFIPRFSATTHIAAFVLGVLVASIRRHHGSK